MANENPKKSPWLEVRRSRIDGTGAFARRRIPRGTRVIEYGGERITHAESDDRYERTGVGSGVTYFFTVDEETVIDGASCGNDARFINHSCDPNCEAVEEGGRIWIEALRDIGTGEELGYDYRLQVDRRRERDWRTRYACRCGSAGCRGVLIELRRRNRVT